MDPTLNVSDLPTQTLPEAVPDLEGEEAPMAPTSVDGFPSMSAFDDVNRDAETYEEADNQDINAWASTDKPVSTDALTATAAAAAEEDKPYEDATFDAAAETGLAALTDMMEDTDDNLLASLFGVNFEIDDDVLTREAIDPNLVDTRDVFTSLFGAATETDVLMSGDNRTELEALMAAHHQASARDEVYDVFGDAIDGIKFERSAAFSVLHMAPPAPVPPAEGHSRSWLVNMPTMFPNRQILHADPQPYFPSACPYLDSNARMLFTPQNVMRWSYHERSKLFLSNARMVRWSDGSVTLHVGSDMHHIQDAKSGEALELLCKTSMVRKGEMEVPALVASVFPHRRCVIESNEAGSIKQAVMHENMVSKEMSSKLALPYTSVPLPKVDWNRPSKSKGPLEEYVATEYARRLKEIQARAKDGKRMSLAEQLDLESKLLQELRNTSVEELKEMQDESRRQETLRAAQRLQTQSRGKRSRLDRDLTLTVDGDEVVYNTVEGDDEEDADVLEDNDNDFESQYQRMYQDNAQESDEMLQQRRKMARLEAEQNAKAEPLIAALQTLVEAMPMTALTYGDIKGTLDYLQSGSFSADMVKKEIPVMLEELKEEIPEIDITKVQEAFQNAF